MSEVLSRAQREMVLANVGLVEHIVQRVARGLPASHSRDDLVQSGMLGLIGATTRFDPSTGAAFSTFAGRRIEGAVIDALRAADWAPRSVRSMQRQVRELRDAGSESPSWCEIGQRLQLDDRQLDRLRRDLARIDLVSLDKPAGEDGLSSLADLIVDDRSSIEDDLADRELRASLRLGLTRLGERHRIVIVGYFFEGRTVARLADLLHISPSRVSQIKEEALGKLRAELVTSTSRG